ncbi:hypothetical protein [Streptomyces sp. NPDC055287]
MELPLAVGLGYPHAEVERIWAEIEKRDPSHVDAQVSALQYWRAKWRGSHEMAEEFGRAAALEGVPGSLLTYISLYAYCEHEQGERDVDPDEFYKAPHIVAAVDAALVDVAAAPEGRQTIRVRHMLAWTLYWQDRYEEAVEQFRHIDGWIGETPWDYAADPVKRYTDARDYCAARVLEARG